MFKIPVIFLAASRNAGQMGSEVKWHNWYFRPITVQYRGKIFQNIIKYYKSQNIYSDEGKILYNITRQDVVCKSNKIKDEIWRFHV